MKNKHVSACKYHHYRNLFSVHLLFFFHQMGVSDDLECSHIPMLSESFEILLSVTSLVAKKECIQVYSYIY